MKKIKLALCILIILLLSSCTEKSDEKPPEVNVTETVTIETESASDSIRKREKVIIPTTEKDTTTEGSTIPSTPVVKENKTTEKSVVTTEKATETTTVSTIERAVSLYKKAAANTESINTVQTLSLESDIGGEGTVATLAGYVAPIVKAALKRNSTQLGYIPGNYDDLNESDITSAEVSENNEKTTVTMQIKPQTTSVKSDGVSGSIGHAVGTLPDIAEQLDKLGVSVDWTKGTVEVTYSDCVVRVEIDNKNNKIISGDWNYDVYFDFKNIKIAGLTIERIYTTVNSDISA